MAEKSPIDQTLDDIEDLKPAQKDQLSALVQRAVSQIDDEPDPNMRTVLVHDMQGIMLGVQARCGDLGPEVRSLLGSKGITLTT